MSVFLGDRLDTTTRFVSRFTVVSGRPVCGSDHQLEVIVVIVEALDSGRGPN
jgi:hypothetical protein